jgi:hypothetical protein
VNSLFLAFSNILIEVLRHHLDDVFSPSRNTFSPQMSQAKESRQSRSPVAVLPPAKGLSKNSRKDQETTLARDEVIELSSQRRERRSKKLNDKRSGCPSVTPSDMKLCHWNFDQKNLLNKMHTSTTQLAPLGQAAPVSIPVPSDDGLLDSFTKSLSKKVS